MAQIRGSRPTAAALKRTPLYDLHVQAGARMVPFGGWAMPVQYPTGVLAEHHAVRQRAGLFDIGHMGQIAFEGPDALEFLQWVTTHDVSRLAVGAAQYSLLCNYDGGVLDDIIVYRLAETRYLMVVNAANADADLGLAGGAADPAGSGRQSRPRPRPAPLAPAHPARPAGPTGHGRAAPADRRPGRRRWPTTTPWRGRWTASRR